MGNAYGWDSQEKKLALKYPTGLEQRNAEGEQLYSQGDSSGLAGK